MPGLHELLPVPDTRQALSQIPSTFKGISLLKPAISGSGAEMSKKSSEDVEDADAAKDEEIIQNDEGQKNIKKSLMPSTSEIGTGR